MIQFRFGLCPHLDAEIIEKATEISNGGSLNNGLRQYLRFLHYQNKCQDVTPERQCNDNAMTNNDNNLAINLSSLDTAFSDLGE
jgi:hypothetical protein